MSTFSGLLEGVRKGFHMDAYYHVTPEQNLPAILRNGLEPRQDSSRVKTRGVYLVQTEYDAWKIALQLRWAEQMRRGKPRARLGFDWVVLRIPLSLTDVETDPDSVREGGVFVRRSVSPEQIKPLYRIKEDSLLSKNYRRCLDVVAAAPDELVVSGCAATL